MPAPKGHPPYNKNGEGGRPVKYTQEVIEDYADKLEIWLENPENFWFKDFAIENKFNANLFYEFSKNNKRFSVVLERAKQKQESKLFKGALVNSFNSGIVKFALNVHHGWVEKKETVHSNHPDNPVPEWILNTEGTSKDLVSDDKEQ